MVQTSTPAFRGNPFVNRSEGREPVVIKTVGIIGAGQMGNGIAHVVALAGYDVLLNDLSKERVEAAIATINGNLSRQVHGGKIWSRTTRRSRISVMLPRSKRWATADVVIEAATEDEDVKRKILTEFGPSEARRRSWAPIRRKFHHPLGSVPPTTGNSSACIS